VQRKVDDWSFKEGLPLVGFKYRKTDDWLDLNSKQEGVRLVGFKYQKGYDWLDLNSKQEGVARIGGVQISEGLRLVGFTIPLFVPRI
jgi:hypothetical protein